VDLSLSGKVALVGGASQGIGYSIAHLLASEGATVAMVARKEEPPNEACARIAAETGATTFAIAADIRKGADCERIISQTLDEYKRIDILVNNDGAPPLGELESFDDIAWQKAIEQNLMSVIRLCRGALPSMKQEGWGRIVNITALSAIQPIARFGLSVATWAGVLGYAKTLSLELANQGITINTICPGRIATGRLATVFGNGTPGQLEQEQMAKITKLIPMGRVGKPNEIAGLVAFLCSPWGAYMTGTVQHVDGGRLGSLF
jgi:3-oxoacyl-[acyl-carrier protein] reductase